MSNRDVDIPVKAETREWLIKTKGELTYDQFLNMSRQVLEIAGLPQVASLYVQSKNNDGSLSPLQQYQLSKKDGMEVTAKNG